MEGPSSEALSEALSDQLECNSPMPVPRSTATSAGSDAWAEPDSEGAAGAPAHSLRRLTFEFGHSLKAALQQSLKLHGGVVSFLADSLCTKEERDKFAEWLWHTFPLQDDTHYHQSRELPVYDHTQAAAPTPSCVHITTLGYARGCSLNAPPDDDVCVGLEDEILADGFLTADDNLRVIQNDDMVEPDLVQFTGGVGTASLSYFKGRTRAAVVLAMLRICMIDECDLKLNHPKLYTSLLRVYVVRKTFESRKAEAFENMKISCRGRCAEHQTSYPLW